MSRAQSPGIAVAVPAISGKDPADHLAVHIGETVIAALVAEGETLVIKAEQVKHRGIQIVGVLAFAIFAIVSSFIVWSIIGAIFGGIRVTEKEEVEGLDIGEHGMEAYPDFASAK